MLLNRLYGFPVAKLKIKTIYCSRRNCIGVRNNNTLSIRLQCTVLIYSCWIIHELRFAYATTEPNRPFSGITFCQYSWKQYDVELNQKIQIANETYL